MTKTQDYKGQIRSKRLGGTGVTEEQIRALYTRKGKFFVGLIEIEVEETHEKKDGNRKVDLLLNQVWLVTGEDDAAAELEAHLRQLMRTLHQNKVLKSDQEALDIQVQGDLEPSVAEVIAAKIAHDSGEPHAFEPGEPDEDGGTCWCGEDFEADVHQVVGATPLEPVDADEADDRSLPTSTSTRDELEPAGT